MLNTTKSPELLYISESIANANIHSLSNLVITTPVCPAADVRSKEFSNLSCWDEHYKLCTFVIVGLPPADKL